MHGVSGELSAHHHDPCVLAVDCAVLSLVNQLSTLYVGLWSVWFAVDVYLWPVCSLTGAAMVGVCHSARGFLCFSAMRFSPGSIWRNTASAACVETVVVGWARLHSWPCPPPHLPKISQRKQRFSGRPVMSRRSLPPWMPTSVKICVRILPHFVSSCLMVSLFAKMGGQCGLVWTV